MFDLITLIPDPTHSILHPISLISILKFQDEARLVFCLLFFVHRCLRTGGEGEESEFTRLSSLARLPHEPWQWGTYETTTPNATRTSRVCQGVGECVSGFTRSHVKLSRLRLQIKIVTTAVDLIKP